ncbi:MAG: hypothetical protein JWN25_2439 [Verrucomicrobiales bacterium]|nr:hypothetical protein [Verrucomicrobiales bacterium]
MLAEFQIMKWIRRLILAVFLLVACPWLHASNALVSMRLLEFVPSTTTVNVGDTVTWTNLDNIGHDSVSGSNGNPDGTWQSQIFGRGISYTVRFLNSGSYPYFCTPHWECCGMIGQVTVVAPNSPPTVQFTGPSTNSPFISPASLVLQAAASDPDGTITKVEFFQNNQSLGVVTSPPYTITVNNLLTGQYGFSVIATDNSGSTAADAIAIRVIDKPANIKPSVNIITPTTGSIVAELSSVPILVNALDSDGTISQLGIFLNGISQGILTAPPYSVTTSPLPVGTYRIEAIAVDDQGAANTNSVTFEVRRTVDQKAPGFTLQPANVEVFAPAGFSLVTALEGNPPLLLQWYHNGNAVRGATNTILSISNSTTLDSGNYFLAATNLFGSARSSNAVVNVKSEICNYELSTFALSLSESQNTRSIALTTSASCAWTISAGDATWIHVLSATQGQGNATIVLTFDANFGPQNRSGTIAIGAASLQVTQKGRTIVPGLAFDLNHDFLPDILVSSPSGQLGIFSSGGTLTNDYRILATPLKIPNGWQLEGTFDFDGNGTPDLIFMTPARALVVWLMNGSQLVQQMTLGRSTVPPLWRMIGVTASRSGSEAVILYHPQGYLAAWSFKNFQSTEQHLLNNGNLVPPQWRPVGLGDFNKDGNLDLLWQHQNGTLMAWFLNNGQVTGGQVLSGLPNPGPAWSLISIVDFDLNGSSDLLWQHKNGDTAMWLLNGVNLKSTIHPFFPSPLGNAWKVVGPK